MRAGVNASDVNFTSGRYFGIKEATRRLPFPAGFEAVGAVAAVGPGVSGEHFSNNDCCMLHHGTDL